MDELPLSIRITQNLLLLSTVVFAILFSISFVFEPTHALQFLYTLLLVVLPAFALIGLSSRAWWGRGLATLALLAVWAFDLRMFWLNTRMDYFGDAVFAGSFYSYFIGMLVAVAIALPLLLLKFHRGDAERAYFEGVCDEPLPAAGERLPAPLMPYSTSARGFTATNEPRS